MNWKLDMAVVLFMGLLAVVLIVLVKRRRAAKTAALAQLREDMIGNLIKVITQVESGDFTEAADLAEYIQWGGVLKRWKDALAGHPLQPRYLAAHELYEDHQEYGKMQNRFEAQVTAWRAATEFGTRAAAASDLQKLWQSLCRRNVKARLSRELNFSYDGFRAEVERMVLEELARLEEKMQDDDGYDAFEAYRSLRRSVLYEGGRLHWTCRCAPYPVEWPRLVARYVRNPTLEEFAFQTTQMEKGMARLRAAAALLNARPDIAEVKLLLAYCNSREYAWVAKEIGEVEAARLARTAEEYNLNHQLI